MKIKVKKLIPEAKIPTRAHENDAGLDLYAISWTFDPYKEHYEYRTGIALEIPVGFVGLVFPRSSIAKKALALCNSVGVIDSDYRGEILFYFKKTEGDSYYDIGDRIGQLIVMPFPKVELVEAEELSDTKRGSGGYGSSGA